MSQPGHYEFVYGEGSRGALYCTQFTSHKSSYNLNLKSVINDYIDVCIFMSVCITACSFVLGPPGSIW